MLCRMRNVHLPNRYWDLRRCEPVDQAYENGKQSMRGLGLNNLWNSSDLSSSRQSVFSFSFPFGAIWAVATSIRVFLFPFRRDAPIMRLSCSFRSFENQSVYFNFFKSPFIDKRQQHVPRDIPAECGPDRLFIAALQASGRAGPCVPANFSCTQHPSFHS